MPDLSALYRQKDPSLVPKATLSTIHAVSVTLACWLLAGGASLVAANLGLSPGLATPLRRSFLAAAAVLYFLRSLITALVFIRRRVPWSEVATVGTLMVVVHLLFAFFGGRQAAPFGLVGWFGASLYLAGSFLNTGSELQRHRWKRRPENKGKLYTSGLFRYAMHINYFGDFALFTGWALMTGCAFLLLIPALMLLGFIFVHIPAQDRYLAERYGEAFRQYAARTRKLIPFLY